MNHDDIAQGKEQKRQMSEGRAALDRAPVKIRKCGEPSGRGHSRADPCAAPLTLGGCSAAAAVSGSAAEVALDCGAQIRPRCRGQEVPLLGLPPVEGEGVIGLGFRV